MKQRWLPGLFLLLLTATGCASARVLAPAPTLYSAENPYPEDRIPDSLRLPEAKIIFATDRVWNESTATFAPARSRAMTAGEVTIRIGQETSWDSLVGLASGDNPSGRRPSLIMDSVRTQTVFPATPIPYRLEGGVVIEDAEIFSAYNASIEAFQSMVTQRLRQGNTDTVLFYVHGFNNGFDDAAFDLTDIWHYSGRGSVPVVFSWPTVEGNLLGYFSARESGEFSIFHLKEVLRALQEIPELETINILAHSRGVDVTTTAIRELIIEARGTGRPLRDVMKLDNLILAAADIDVAVASQRLAAERFALAVGHITIYANPGDGALRLSSLVSSGLRVGRSTSASYEESFGAAFLGIDSIVFVDVSGLSGNLGHNYFRLNPGVIADIATILQTGAGPRDPARGLIPVGGNFYELVE
ncbi:alpha/beta hydrolase [Aquisalinus flavus]|uniref:Alpha/beta hydrolase n=1 Tax=Aquisalinus flavus TaxID=1526572 RepID=A0A8J2Y817_9PROT|nr:alpha/beta hydrolase [Aquisalinus flavus]MBD0425980.1 alpha/beta hydrolase [Aquisalinus flavus]UNE48429.1 alpha/beta hydrolase [Aquisalinus flavus]GGD11682.1 hypothetical protein GCM10011342_20620 [Aquisalinus flavus]